MTATGRAASALLCLLALVPELPAQSATDDLVPYRGAVMTGVIRPGGPAVTSVSLTAGQFLRLEVLKAGTDLNLELHDPSGKSVASADFGNGKYGPVILVVLTEVPGIYRLSVGRASPAGPPENYTIAVAEMRHASDSDRETVAAFRNYNSGVNARSAEAVRRSIDQLTLSRDFFRRSRDQYMEGLATYGLGAALGRAGDFRGAASSYLAARELFQLQHDRHMEAEALNSEGGVRDVLGEAPAAMKLYEEAIALFSAEGDRTKIPLALNNLATVEAQLSQWQRALDRYRQALPLLRDAGDRTRENLVVNNMGIMYTQLGDTDEALRLFESALAARRALADKPGEAATLEGMASAYIQRADFARALPYLEQAQALRKVQGSRGSEAQVLILKGQALQRLQRLEEAVECLLQAADMARSVGDRRRTGQAWTFLAVTFLAANDPARAFQYGQLAVAEFRAIGNHLLESVALEASARAEADQGRVTGALGYMEQSLTMVEGSRRGTDSQQHRATFFAARQDGYSFYIDLLMRAGGLDALALETSERSRARSLLEMMAASGTAIREGVDTGLLERERSISDRLNAKGSRLLALNAADQRAAELRQEIRDLEAEYQDVQTAIRKSSPRYAAVSQPGILTVAQIQQNLLDADTLLLEYSLGEERSYLWVVGKEGLKSFRLEGRATIEAKAMALAQLVAAHAPERTLDAAAAELSRVVLGDAGPALGNKRLLIVPDGGLQSIPFAMLPEPGTRDPLLVRHEVVIAPSASALAALRTQVTGRTPPPKSLAVFADPVFDGSDPRAGAVTLAAVRPDTSRVLEHLVGEKNSAANVLHIPRLPYTAQEADRILRIVPDASNLKAVGFDASRAMAIGGRLNEFKYLHFATHGYLDTERPELSALVLSQIDSHNQPEDGFLRVDDIYNARLSADLVVLSACQTGLGKEVRGEGLMGLTRAFLYAGVPEVIVSLWNVNDRATAELMATFYEKLLRHGKRPSAALREAQLNLRKQKRWESPYYWAAFVQQGDWR